MTAIDDYLAGLPAPQRDTLDHVRAVARAAVPEAVDVLSYRMPTLDYRGKHLLHFAAFTRHMSLFPGTIRFTADDPVPDAVVEEMVLRRRAEIDAEIAPPG